MKISCPDTHGNILQFDESDFVDRVSVYGVYIKDGTVLMVQDAVSGTWDFPGGGVEEGEDLVQAMRREFIEETGFSIGENVELLTTFKEYYKDIYSEHPWRSNRSFYTVTVTGGEILPEGNGDDTVKAAFLPLDKIKTYPLRQPIRNVIALLGRR